MQQQRQQFKRHPHTGEALRPIYVSPKTGRAFYPILGASEGDDPPGGNDPDPNEKLFTQADLTAKATEEKRQGKRAGAREVMETLGFGSLEEAQAFIDEKRKADDEAKSEVERREAAAAERERKAEERERKAIERERIANHRAALVALGATGDDLDDAVRLFSVADDAEPDEVTAAAEALKERRPELFGSTEDPTPGKPRGTLPAGKPPKRKTPENRGAGASGRAAAARRGWGTKD